jgi:hypothetical protein
LTLSRKHVVRMKRALFKSLRGYSYKVALPLLKSGYRSKDKEVRVICQNIMKKHEGSPRA